MSEDNNNFLLLLDKLSEIGERTVRMETEQKNMKDDLEEVKRQDVLQNQLLAEHIQGVKSTNERLSNEIAIRNNLSDRVEKLEITPKFFKSVWSICVYFGTIVGIVYEFGRILHKW